MIEIKEMTKQHVCAIAELEIVCFSDPWSEKSISYELTNPLSDWLVAIDGDTVAGYVGSQSVLDEADMMNIAVAPEYRRQGIADILISELIQRLTDRGVCMLTLEVRVSNTPAICLYEKLGFQTVGKRPNYYAHPKEDALIMRKEWRIEDSCN